VDIGFILDRAEDLKLVAEDFCVSKLFKCEKFEEGEQHVYGTEHGAELVIVRDIPGMISTSAVIQAIKAGKTRLGPIPVTGHE
jgi:hypothetical protein